GNEPADQAVQQGRLARAVRPDDGVDAALAHRQVDVGQGAQAGEALVHAEDLEDGRHSEYPGRCWALASAGCSRLRPRGRLSRRQMRRMPSAMPPGRKITTIMNIRPRVRCQPSLTKEPVNATTGSRSDSGRKSKIAWRRCSLKAEKIFSKYLISPAPNSGPTRVPAPPRIVMSTTSPDAVHCMRSAPTSGSVTASSAPASPAYIPEMTKAASM